MPKQKQLTCIVRLKKGKRKVPAFAVLGNWAVHPLVLGDGKELQLSTYTASVTHLPTGLRARHIGLRKDYTKILVRYNALFGKAATLTGVIRKYRAFSKEDKYWATHPC